ncbi:MAG: di-heme oxidoredictase family protein [Planctomycetota bacterium]
MPSLRARSVPSALAAAAIALSPSPGAGQVPPGEGPAIRSPRLTQAEILSGGLTLLDLRRHGLRMFATPFNQHDGFGDGPMNPANPTDPGGRPTLQNNGMHLRANGLDAQTCMECHSVLSSATVPFRFGIGGVGGANNNVMAGPTEIDIDDSMGLGFAGFDGRFINPPFLMGAGGVEIIAKEMTIDLQNALRRAKRNPGTVVPLVTKDVSFGSIRVVGDRVDTSAVEGVDHDLVVRPFGRKGEFATTRAFDVEALRFHFGMEPVEAVGHDVDADHDGVVNEALVGEVSALQIFGTTLEPPVVDDQTPESRRGRGLFRTLGCADCHIPELTSRTSLLTYSFPPIETEPLANVYYAVDLARAPTRFARAPSGGIRVPMFSDLKRHDMGPRLAETTGKALDPLFVTPRLWGVADTAPYLHDGRALTLSDAILMHGGEAQTARDAFAALAAADRVAVLTFLRTLRTPVETAVGLTPLELSKD